MENKLLEVLKREDVQKQVIELYCELYRKRFYDGNGTGWLWKIIVDIDGDVDYMYCSQGTSRMDVFEGKAMVVATIKDSPIDIEMGSVTDVEDLEQFKEYIMTEYYLDNENEDDLDRMWDYVNWENYYEFNKENYKQIERDMWEAICDYYSYDEISEKLHYLIEDMEERASYVESMEYEE